MSDVVFETAGLTHRYPAAARDTLHDITLEVPRGRIYTIVGPNGSGKSTLLRVLLGTLRASAGTVLYGGRPIQSWERAALAREIGVVTQGEEQPFPIRVRDLVALGRYPHIGAWRRESATDRAAVQRALERCEVADLAERFTATLSGGERQRVRIARALAQEPRTLVLDEPTASLDIAHEMAIFELLAQLTATEGTTVLLVTHNLNLAARYADAMVLLDRGGCAAAGAPADVLDRDRLERVYHWPLMIQPFTGSGVDAGVPQVVPARRRGGVTE